MLDAKTVRSLSKAGMVASLAVLALTGLGRGRSNRNIHVLAGVALIGFSVWHYNVCRPPERRMLATKTQCGTDPGLSDNL